MELVFQSDGASRQNRLWWLISSELGYYRIENSMERNKLNPVQKEKRKDFNHSEYIFRIKK